MQPVLNIEDVKRVERELTHVGVSTSELMHRAGISAAQEALRMEGVERVVVLVGVGNNGGDGWVAAENLAESGVHVTVITPIDPAELKGDLAPVVARSAVAAGVPVLVAPPRDDLDELLLGSDVVLDAILGTGFHGEPSAPFDNWIDAVNLSGTRVISVDVPSGLSAQTGHAAQSCIVADETLTMLALKPGLLADEGRDVCGAIVVAPLAEQTEQLVVEADPVAWRCESSDYVSIIEPPTCAVDKFSRGSVLVVGGSTRFPGAAIMAAKAAARAGAGYVTLAVPEPVAAIARAHLLEIPVVGLPAEKEGVFSPDGRADLIALAERSAVTLAGPGMRVCASTVSIVSALLETKIPLVLDADALNCLARLTSNRLDNFPELIRRSAPLVLTPHRRELGRLMGLPDTPPDSLTSALEASRRIVWSDGGSELCIVAKGTATACVGVEVALLPKPGPASLATAGSGDVLGGIIASFLAHRPVDPEDIPLLCSFACEVHGYAGSIAAERRGSRGAMASDIIDAIGLAVDALEEHATLVAAGADEQNEA
ncbi:MAG: NAD(P)H-hydrate dehydratase [Atopobiaceae bacterium]|jgi:NAD(P)H-hydrate epimerase|nr:NAD(P)H-hydrate dehydratase [Atopobiaceae bacterium]MCH4179965.1 NAD(P)H-hydrate dehydratase [Atopobiaceae bacterium]MCH4213716.1 NAD(P)H-hydrate dehydratase [Atopobiaceae bacterium]MCH4230061.1 NAD(P)H-hydrate dehydratase [Atopobiaceae bacterium]MCH4275927.1 NAD(P)H-hydrate dehydratase [Atopobiaceae bacterium]